MRLVAQSSGESVEKRNTLMCLYCTCSTASLMSQYWPVYTQIRRFACGHNSQSGCQISTTQLHNAIVGVERRLGNLAILSYLNVIFRPKYDHYFGMANVYKRLLYFTINVGGSMRTTMEKAHCGLQELVYWSPVAFWLESQSYSVSCCACTKLTRVLLEWLNRYNFNQLVHLQLLLIPLS